MLGLLGAGEVAHQQRDAVVFRADARRERGGLVHRNAEPVHAGVDMQRGAAAPGMGRAESVPFRQFDHAADHRPHVDVGVGGSGARQQTVEHIDRRLRRRAAHLGGLGEIGDEEGLAAGARQPGGHLLDAAAVAVGLDHGGAFRRHDAVGQRAPIGFDGREIDGQDAARLRRRRAGGDEHFRRAIVRRACVLLNGGFCLGHGRGFSRPCLGRLCARRARAVSPEISASGMRQIASRARRPAGCWCGRWQKSRCRR